MGNKEGRDRKLALQKRIKKKKKKGANEYRLWCALRGINAAAFRHGLTEAAVMWTRNCGAHSSCPGMGRAGAARSRLVQPMSFVSAGFQLGTEPGTRALLLICLAPFSLAAERTLGSTRASHLVELNRREQGFGRDKRTYHCSINGLITER